MPNKIFSIVATIKNTSGRISFDTFATISAPSDFEILSSSSVLLGTIYSDGEKTATWAVRARSSGASNVILTYHSSSLGSDSFAFPVSILSIFSGSELAPLTAFWGMTPSNPPLPGDTNVPVGILIVNRGNRVAFNVTGSLVVDEPFYWSYPHDGRIMKVFSQTSNAGLIGPDQNATLRFFLNVDPSAEEGNYPNKLRLTYTDGSDFFDKTFEVMLPVAEIPSISVKTDHSVGLPGHNIWVNITLTNNGRNSVHGLTVSVQRDSALTPLNTPISLGSLGHAESKVASFLVSIDREAVASDYPVRIEISYVRGGISTNDTRVVGIRILGAPLVVLGHIRVEPETVYPGDKGNKLMVNVINDGYAPFENLRATLHLEGGFEPSWGGSDSFFLGRLMPRENRSAVFFVDVSNSVQSGVYPIKMEFDSNGDLTTIDIPIIVSRRANFEVITVQDSGLYPGASAASVRVMIKNNGSSTAETVTAKLLGGNKLFSAVSDSGATTGNTELLGTINPNQSAEVSFLVDVDPYLTPGNHILTIELSWKEGDRSFTDNEVISLKLMPGNPSLILIGGIPWLYVIISGSVVSLFAIYAGLRAKRQRAIEKSNQDSDEG